MVEWSLCGRSFDKRLPLQLLVGIGCLARSVKSLVIIRIASISFGCCSLPLPLALLLPRLRRLLVDLLPLLLDGLPLPRDLRRRDLRLRPRPRRAALRLLDLSLDFLLFSLALRSLAILALLLLSLLFFSALFLNLSACGQGSSTPPSRR